MKKIISIKKSKKVDDVFGKLYKKGRKAVSIKDMNECIKKFKGKVDLNIYTNKLRNREIILIDNS